MRDKTSITGTRITDHASRIIIGSTNMSARSDRFFDCGWPHALRALIPHPAKEFAAVGQVMAVRGKDLERDRVIVTAILERTHVMGRIDVAGA